MNSTMIFVTDEKGLAVNRSLLCAPAFRNLRTKHVLQRIVVATEELIFRYPERKTLNPGNPLSLSRF